MSAIALRSRSSRSAHSKGLAGSASTVRVCPLTLRLIAIALPPLNL